MCVTHCVLICFENSSVYTITCSVSFQVLMIELRHRAVVGLLTDFDSDDDDENEKESSNECCGGSDGVREAAHGFVFDSPSTSNRTYSASNDAQRENNEMLTLSVTYGAFSQNRTLLVGKSLTQKNNSSMLQTTTTKNCFNSNYARSKLRSNNSSGSFCKRTYGLSCLATALPSLNIGEIALPPSCFGAKLDTSLKVLVCESG